MATHRFETGRVAILLMRDPKNPEKPASNAEDEKPKRSLPSKIVLSLQDIAEQDDDDLARILHAVDEEEPADDGDESVPERNG